MRSDHMWDRVDEWTDYAPCVGNLDFITAPEELGPERTENVIATCAGCPVRPECIELNVAPVIDLASIGRKHKSYRPSNSMWVAGEWLPDLCTAESRRELEAKREELMESLPH